MSVRVAIIGCGVIGPTHLESFTRVSDSEVLWACDLVEEKARGLAEKYNIPHVTTDYRAVLQDPKVDAVSICTDHASHAEIAIAAFEAGKHVLCEKALTADCKKLDAMFAAHARHPGLLFAGVFQHRFDPAMQHMRQLVQEGVFGTLLTAGLQMRCLRTNEYYDSAPWRGTWAEEGGAVLINQGIHFIDLLLWITGGVSRISGTWANLAHGQHMETEDTAVAALQFKSGALGTLEATCASHLKWENTISIHGTEGSIDMRGSRPIKVAFQDSAKEEAVRHALENAREQRSIDAGADHYGFGHPAQIADFVHAIKEGRRPFVEASCARHAVELVMGLYRSAQEGGWVDLP